MDEKVEHEEVCEGVSLEKFIELVDEVIALQEKVIALHPLS